jgi:hypothetical protein
LAACGPRTPEDLIEEARTAMEMGDAVETELLLQKLFAMEEIPDEIAVEGHMLRAVNFIRGLQDQERALAELEAIVDLVGPTSSDGLSAVMNLAAAQVRERGLEGWQEEIDRLIGDSPLDSEDQLTLSIQRWQILTSLNASPEKREMFPDFWAEIASAEFLEIPQRRALALNLVRDRATLALAEGNLDDALAAFDLFIGEHAGTEPADFMMIEASSHLRAAGRNEEADLRAAAGLASIEARLTAAETSQEEATALLMVADAQQMLDEIEIANVTYNSIFDTYLDFQHRPRAMLGWALALAQRGSMEESLTLLTRTGLEYPNSPFSVEAGRLTGAIQMMQAQQASLEATGSDPVTREMVEAMAVSPESASPGASL